MKPLNLKVVASALSLFGVITFSLCILWDLAFPSLSMLGIWRVLPPGFQGIGWGSYLLGLVEMVLYCLYTAVIFVPLYNWLARSLPGQPMTAAETHHV
jgi:P-type Cu+ transporter